MFVFQVRSLPVLRRLVVTDDYTAQRGHYEPDDFRSITEHKTR